MYTCKHRLIRHPLVRLTVNAQCLGELEGNLRFAEESFAGSVATATNLAGPLDAGHGRWFSAAASLAGGGGGASTGAVADARGAGASPPQDAPATAAAATALPAAVEIALAEGLRGLSVRVGLACQERRAVARFQLERLEGLAAPAHARVLMWLMVQVSLFVFCVADFK